MLKIPATQDSSDLPCLIKIDHYVPISFQSQNLPLAGARHIHIGNGKTQLLDLIFPPDSLALRGFTLVVAETSKQGGLVGEAVSTAGLPVVSLLQEQLFSGRTPRLQVHANVALSCSNDYAEVRLGSADTFDRGISHGRVQFLTSNGILVGLRVLSLTNEERQTLLHYIEEHSHE